MTTPHRRQTTAGVPSGDVPPCRCRDEADVEAPEKAGAALDA
jgi:hypothetical protein